MKKVVGIIFLIIILISTVVFAAYPENLEKNELEELQDEFMTLTSEQIQDAEELIETPESEGEMLTEATEEAVESDVSLEEGDLYEINSDVTIGKMVNGNVYVIGQNVIFDNAVIHGNAFVLGHNIEFKNTEINGSLYVAGETITFAGTTNDIYACGADITLNKDAHIWRDVKVAGENIKLNGSIGRNVYAGANNLVVDDNIIITGELNYASENEAAISDNAQIGKVNFEKQEKTNNEEDKSQARFNPSSIVFSLLGTFIK